MLGVFDKALGRLPVRGKFFLIGAAGLLAVMVPTWQALHGLYERREAARKEINGLAPARAMLDVLIAVREARALNTLVAGGAKALRSQRDAAVTQTDRAIAYLAETINGRAQFPGAQAALNEARALWAPVAVDARADAIDAANNRARFLVPFVAFERVLDSIRDESGHTYAFDASRYHLMQAALGEGPVLLDRLGDARGRGSNYLSAGAMDEWIRGQLIMLGRDIAESGIALAHELDKAQAAGAGLDGVLELAAARQAAESARAQALTLIQQLAAPRTPADTLPYPEAYSDVLAEAMFAEGRLLQAAMDHLARLSIAHARDIDRRFWGTAVLLMALVGFGGLVVVVFARQAIGATTEAVRVAEAISQLRLNNRIEVGNRDEFGALMQALAAMQERLRERIERERALRLQLANEHERLQVTLASIADAVFIIQTDGTLGWINPAAERLLELASRDTFGQTFKDLVVLTDDKGQVFETCLVTTCIKGRQVVSFAGRLARDYLEAGSRPVELTAAPIPGGAEDLAGVIVVLRDVSEQRRMGEEILYRATHDALTGLFNRSEFEARLQRLLEGAKAEGGTHALMYIDLDRFKIVNDACGHAAGDHLLCQIAALLSDIVRQSDTLARLGGDEFGILLQHCTSAEAQRVGSAINEAMDAFRFMHGDQHFRIGASIGLVQVDARFDDVAELLKAADVSCYAAKDAGRNRMHEWQRDDDDLKTRKTAMQWAARIEQAIDDRAFVLFGQRILTIDREDDRVDIEVLLRLQAADGSLLSPAVFLPAAERFQLASRLDLWVLGEVLRQLSLSDALAEVGLVAINLSGQSVGDPQFHAATLDMLASVGHEVCNRLCLEITETAAIGQIGGAAQFIGKVRRLGVRIALDDFGTGASSFGYLKALPVDLLKIDGQFVRDLLNDPLDVAAVRCFVDVAKVMGVRTVAEYVECDETLAILRRLGVDHAQGYAIHRPEPLEQALRARLTTSLV